MSLSPSASDLSDLTELSSPDSVISFSDDVDLAMRNNNIITVMYVEQARRIIQELATYRHRWITTPPGVNRVDASRVLDAMLKNARDTGGESSERYTACAICTCKAVHEQVDLARTWFMYLLWPFEAGSHHPPNDPDMVSDETTTATPTTEDTFGILVSASHERRGGFRDDVNERNGYRCAISGLWDEDHRPAGSDQPFVTLIGAHILKRAVGVFTMERAHAAAATWTIIRHYSALSEETIRNMEMLVDDPFNGMMLESNIHNVFDKLKVYLEQTEQENEYIVRQVSSGGPWISHELLDKTITFQNHAAPTRDVPLPNPHFIALHAGISRILHMSGAAEIFAQIMDKYDGARGNAGTLKGNGDPVHQLSSMVSALSLTASLIA